MYKKISDDSRSLCIGGIFVIKLSCKTTASFFCLLAKWNPNREELDEVTLPENIYWDSPLCDVERERNLPQHERENSEMRSKLGSKTDQAAGCPKIIMSRLILFRWWDWELESKCLYVRQIASLLHSARFPWRYVARRSPLLQFAVSRVPLLLSQYRIYRKCWK
jgi:hypothetical protein